MLELLGEVAAAGPVDSRPARTCHQPDAGPRRACASRCRLCVVECDEPQGLHFDSVIAPTEHAFYVRGWAATPRPI